MVVLYGVFFCVLNCTFFFLMLYSFAIFPYLSPLFGWMIWLSLLAETITAISWIWSNREPMLGRALLLGVVLTFLIPGGIFLYLASVFSGG